MARPTIAVPPFKTLASVLLRLPNEPDQQDRAADARCAGTSDSEVARPQHHQIGEHQQVAGSEPRE
jgi:hypothetical protein